MKMHKIVLLFSLIFLAVPLAALAMDDIPRNTDTMTINSRTRTYYYSDDGISGKDVVIVLHGAGSGQSGLSWFDEEWTNYLSETKSNPIQQEFTDMLLDNGFAVVAPQSRTDLSGAGGSPSRWQHIPGVDDDPEDVDFIAAVVTWAKNQGADNIYIVGLSSGAFMTARMGAELEDEIAGAVVVSGADPSQWAAGWGEYPQIYFSADHCPTRIISATGDTTIPYQEGNHYFNQMNVYGRTNVASERWLFSGVYHSWTDWMTTDYNTPVDGTVTNHERILDFLKSSSWKGATSYWSTAGNWTNGAPSASNNAYITEGGTVYATSGNAAYNLVLSSACHSTYGAGGSSLLIGSGDTVTTQNEFIGYIPASGQYQLGSITHSGGTHTVNGYLRFGWDVRTKGSYNFTSGYLYVYGAEMVGRLGVGTFTQSNGYHQISNSLYLGLGAGGEGTYTQTGGTIQVRGDIYIGQAGTGTYNLNNGNLLSNYSANCDIYIGNYDGSDGTLNVANSAALYGRDIYVGSPTYTGEGLLNQTGGAITALYAYVGYYSGDGEYDMSGGTITSHLRVGANGFCDFSGGSISLYSLTIDNGGAIDVDVSQVGCFRVNGNVAATLAGYISAGKIYDSSLTGTLGARYVAGGNYTEIYIVSGYGDAGFGEDSPYVFNASGLMLILAIGLGLGRIALRRIF